MKRTEYLFAGLFAVGGLAGSVIVTYATPRKSVEAAYSQLENAMQRKDLHAYMQLLSPEYTERRLKGDIRTREQAENNCEFLHFQLPLMLQSVRLGPFALGGTTLFITTKRCEPRVKAKLRFREWS